MKLHIGGKEKKSGWKILNIQEEEGVDFVGTISNLTQFDDNSIDEIYASHVLEHVGRVEMKSTLKGIYRVLKKNGKFYISVPDLDILCKIFIDSKTSLEQKFDVMRIIFGGQIDKFDFHYFGWNIEILANYLNFSGFRKMERVKNFSLFNDTSNYTPWGIPISLNVVAYK
jgi:predicted SAM-dependent methyltransferase|tara:strand:+ start:167 stop:676 length:510 start_codon:yes stop_codon:yes gene_type:complete